MESDRQKPDRKLSARSVVASTLLGMHPPVLPARILRRSGEPFGIAAGAVDVVLMQMVSAGELVAADGVFRLAGRLLDRQQRQDVSRTPPRWGWDRRWRMAVVVGDQSPANDRTDLRGRLRLARYAELREGVWTRPDNLPGPRPEDDGCEWIKATFDDPADTAASLWDLVGWAGRARALEIELTKWETRLDGAGVAVLPAAFVLAADVLRHLQSDPLLPRELLANDWPGTSLRSGYDAFEVAFRRVWRDWYRSVR